MKKSSKKLFRESPDSSEIRIFCYVPYLHKRIANVTERQVDVGDFECNGHISNYEMNREYLEVKMSF